MKGTGKPVKVAIGRIYEFEHMGATQKVKVVSYDPVDKMHVVRRTESGKESRLDFAKLARTRAIVSRRDGSGRLSTKACKLDTHRGVFLYICRLGANTYKLGASCDPARRLKQIQTCNPGARMVKTTRIPPHKGAQWSALEQAVLSACTQSRTKGAGREVRIMDDRTLERLVATTQRLVDCA
jgi:hypothetical protein